MLFSREKLIHVMMLLLVISTSFNAVLSGLGIKYLYVIPVLTIIAVSLLQGMHYNQIRKYGAVFSYIVLLSLLSYGTILTNADFMAIKSLLIYTLPLVMWICVYSSHNKIQFYRIFVCVAPVFSIVGYLSFVQYFFSPDFFGLLKTNSNGIIWALESDFEDYSKFFRATSTAGSPQVLGLMCALSIVLTHRFRKYFSNRKEIFIQFGLIIGVFLSANKLSFVIVLGYFSGLFLISIVRNKKVFLLFFIVCLLFSVILPNIYDRVPILQRVFDIQEVLAQETRDSRLYKYAYIISNDEFLIGRGMGSSVELRDVIGASESYLLQIYYEGGGLLLSNFLFFLFLVLIMSAKHSKEDFMIVSLFCFSLLVVHSFESPVFIVFWGYLLSFYPTVATPKKYINAEF